MKIFVHIPVLYLPAINIEYRYILLEQGRVCEKALASKHDGRPSVRNRAQEERWIRLDIEILVR